MNQVGTAASATVTFAVYGEAPIACQGDDDQRKISVITQQLAGEDIEGDALRLSLALSAAHDSHIQVWHIQRNPATAGN